MFRKWRIKRLKRRIAVKRAYVGALITAEKEYGSSYYTDLYIRGYCELKRLEFCLAELEA